MAAHFSNIDLTKHLVTSSEPDVRRPSLHLTGPPTRAGILFLCVCVWHNKLRHTPHSWLYKYKAYYVWAVAKWLQIINRALSSPAFLPFFLTPFPRNERQWRTLWPIAHPPFSQRCCTVLLAVSEQRADGNGRCADHLLKSASRSTHIRLLHSSDVARTGLGTAVKRVVRKHAPSLNCLSVCLCVLVCGVRVVWIANAETEQKETRNLVYKLFLQCFKCKQN